MRIQEASEQSWYHYIYKGLTTKEGEKNVDAKRVIKRTISEKFLKIIIIILTRLN